ncbi:HAMP domain-containing sensor histidine kinase [Oscillospiraceae bacterium MB08-C2-2]|nr:HAMP domain-containing sensor histidine kinase [Oscillospiraceae bacterium MB08-C2-2]
MAFTAVLWLLSLIIYLSDRCSKTNRWLAVSGLVFSLGTLKEVLFYDVLPQLMLTTRAPRLEIIAACVYSLMTSVLYHYVMPCLFVFALYFYEAHPILPKRFRLFKAVALCFPLILMLIFPPLRTRELQQTSLIFWYTVTVYNLTYGVLVTVLMIKSVLGEKWSASRREKRRISFVVLPPVWFWLITIFVIHSLRIQAFFKVWQGNTYLMGIILVFYLVAAFREGMMGIRLRGEPYKWDISKQEIDKGARYTSHILKNELTKIEWCMQYLTLQLNGDTPEELKIIGRSTEHLKQFVYKTQLYASDIVLDRKLCLAKEIIESSVHICREYGGPEIIFDVLCGEEMVLCDRDHLIEVLNNIIYNAIDAMNHCGTIAIVFKGDASRKYQALLIKDSGGGIPQEDLRRIFEPYFSTKTANKHFGLGLSYCFNVMKQHNGYIDIQSKIGEGAAFTLYFPKQRRSIWGAFYER